MAEYQDLEIHLQAIDDASKTLNNVVNLLEKIKKLSYSNNNINTSNSANNISNSTQKAANATKNLIEKEKLLADITRDIKQAQQGSTNAQIALNKARNSATLSAQKYAEKEKNVENALLRQKNAQQALNEALKEKQTIESYISKGQVPPGYTFSGKNFSDVDFGLGEAEKKISEAQKELDSANKAVASSTKSASSAYAQYINSLDTVQSATNRVENEQKKLEESNKKLEESNKKTAQSFTSIASKITILVRLVRKLANGLTSSIEESAEFVENLNLFAVTFGKNYQKTLDWALDFADNLGVASNEIIRFTGLFKQLSDAIGISSDMGTEMSKVLTQLGYDLASFYNISTESAFEKLQAGIFSGQTKPLRSLGLDVTQQTLDNLLKTDEAFKNIGVTSSKALLQSEKAMLRLIVVLKNAQNSFGDINRTINTLSNQIRVFQSSLSNLRLAIGDLIAEPFRNALIYVNAFLIAITKIIRAFKPVETVSETAGAGMQQFADDTEDAIDAATGGGKLDFDEFRVLSTGEDEQVSINEIINAELEKQIALYNEQISSLDTINNKAVQIAENIKNWFIVTDKEGNGEEGNFVEWTSQAKTLAAILTTGVFAKIAGIGAEGGFFKNISTAILECATSTKGLTSQVTLLGKAFTLIQTHPIILVIAAIVALMAVLYKSNENVRESINNLLQSLSPLLNITTELFISILKPIVPILDYLMQLLGVLLPPILNLLTLSINQISLALVPVAFILELIIKLIQSAIQLTTDLFSLNWSNLGKNQEQIWSNWSSVDFAKSSWNNYASSFKNLLGFANGGITDANFIMTHENGVREWVGKQGNSTAVVNDTQMTDVMGKAVRNGVLEALSYNTGNGEIFNITVQANLDGQKVYESTKRIARRNGEKFARV